MQAPKTLEFRPLSEGLGFHPFSDGLPYAPISKRSPRPSAPAEVPELHAPSAVLKVGRTSAPLVAPHSAAPRVDPFRPQRVVARPAALRPPAPPAREQTAVAAPIRLRRFYLTRRVLAFALDTVLNLTLSVGLIAVVFWQLQLDFSAILEPELLSGSLLFLFVFHWFSLGLQETLLHTSFGKVIFGLRLEGSMARIFLRSLLFFPSFFVGGMGLMWGLARPDRRTWHDLLADLQPTERQS